MKNITVFLLLAVFAISAFAQKKRVIDSLNKALSKTNDDTIKARLYSELGRQYSRTRPDTDLLLQETAMHLALGRNCLKLQAMIFNSEGIAFYNTGNYPKALNCYFSALKLNQGNGDIAGQTKNLYNIANIYTEEGDPRQAIKFALKEKALSESIHDKHGIAYALTMLGILYTDAKMPDSGLFYQQQAYRLSMELKNNYLLGGAALDLGRIYAAKKNPALALEYYHKAIIYQQKANDRIRLSLSLLRMATVFKQLRKPDSGIYYARKAMMIADRGHYTRQSLSISIFLTGYFKDQGLLDSAFHYQEISLANRDSLYNWQKTRQVMEMGFAEHDRENQIAMQAVAFRAATRFYIMLVVLAFLLVLAVIFWHNSVKRKRAATLLQKQKEQIKATLDELETTQNQLVHAAKMASLGELTAGIAHEIQNPLNFVNNFSEVSMEMTAELDEELKRGDLAEARLITADIKQNLEKIRHHGGRADSIVRGMLEHSRTTSGQKESVDLNLLVDEFLRLAYHGMRAKDKSASAAPVPMEICTHFDDKLPNINLVPQDMGRVLLNIFNNAFYAVLQKNRTGNADYQPKIEVNTSFQQCSVIIAIKDNGTGIPENIRDKIMQPFFTTKPAGEGTGLGLSLSYDIVVKGHGGKININTSEGLGSEFLILLPV